MHLVQANQVWDLMEECGTGFKVETYVCVLFFDGRVIVRTAFDAGLEII